MSESDWDTVTVLRKKPQKSSQLKSEQVRLGRCVEAGACVGADVTGVWWRAAVCWPGVCGGGRQGGTGLWLVPASGLERPVGCVDPWLPPGGPARLAAPATVCQGGAV